MAAAATPAAARAAPVPVMTWGRRLREAAEIIAQQARQNAGGWSARIPPSIKVNGGSSGISISSSCAARVSQ